MFYDFTFIVYLSLGRHYRVQDDANTQYWSPDGSYIGGIEFMHVNLIVLRALKPLSVGWTVKLVILPKMKHDEKRFFNRRR
jgi:isoprenylcysteine carboxyl methyltransferase (ICMT) family protein YpbQ